MHARAVGAVRRLALFWLFCGLCGLASASVTAQRALPFQVEIAHAQETAVAHSPADLSGLVFVPLEGELALAFPSSATWIRLQLTQPTADSPSSPWGDDAYTLRVGPNILGRVDLFERVEGGWSSRTDEGFDSVRLHRCQDELHCFRITPFAAPAQTLYLRIQSSGVRRIQVEILGSQDLLVATVERVRGINTSLTLGACILALALYLLAVDRSALTLVFVLFQASIILGVICISGLMGRAWMFAAANLSTATYGSIVLRTLMISLLSLVFLHRHQPTQAYKAMSIAAIALSIVNLLLIAAERTQLALMMNLFTWTVSPLIQVYGAASARDFKPSIRLVFLSANGLLLLFTMAALNRIYGGWSADAYGPAFTSFNDLRLNGAWASSVFLAVVVLEHRHQEQRRLAAFSDMQRKAEANRQAAAQLSERKSLIDMLTHELKNPLGTIRFAVEALRTRMAHDDDGQQRVRNVQSCVTRMDKLIEHVALANKIELLEAPLYSAAVRVQPIVSELLQQLGLGGRVACRIQAAATVCGDPQLITVILENLLKNAQAYGRPEQPIELSIAMEPEGSTRLEMSNAVAAEAMPDPQRVFTRYYRHTQAQVNPGMGIGLNLVHSTVTKLGGTIDYRPGQGRVTFIVRIPS